MARKQRDIIVVLYNIRSVENVGSIFRTADATHISHIHLAGYTPSPVDEMGVSRERFTKTALGAEHTVAWDDKLRTSSAIKKQLAAYRDDDYAIVAAEQDSRALSLPHYHPSPKTIVIVGNEIKGVPKFLLDYADRIIEIPMLGMKESLNVSVAFGIIAYHIRFS